MTQGHNRSMRGKTMGGIDEIGYSGQSGSLWLNGKRCEKKGDEIERNNTRGVRT